MVARSPKGQFENSLDVKYQIFAGCRKTELRTQGMDFNRTLSAWIANREM